MPIDVTGPDGSSFSFPDGTPSETVTSALAKHYGEPKTEPASVPYDKQELHAQDTRALLRGVPIVGPLATNRLAAGLRTAFNGGDYSTNLSQEEQAQKDFEKEHPVLDAVTEGIGGTLALGGAGGLVPGAARVLGMTGKVLPAMKNAALSGAAIGGLDTAARGGDVSTGATTGALTGAAGVVGGKLLGRGVDAAGRALAREVPTPQRFIDVNGERVPVRESVETGNPDTSRAEQNFIKEGQPAAVAAEDATQAAMAKTHSNLSEALDPTGARPATTPLEAGDAAAGDLVSREQARAAAEVQRLQSTANETGNLRASMDAPVPQGAQTPPPAPHMPDDVGTTLSTSLRDLFGRARAATRAAYEAQGQLPGEFNPSRLLGSGEAIRMRLNSAPGNDRVRISPEVTPTAQAALRTIDEEVGGLRFTNDAARGQRPITPADVEQARKQLVILRRQANNAARTTGNWEDARAVGRVIDEFDNHIARVAQRPGGFTGDAQAYLSGQQNARALHASERAAFSRRGPGDAVGSMMENIIGKYPNQEMSPQKIIKTLLGSPDSPGGPEHAVAALEHLRNVLGENSREWSAVKKAAISHFTEPLPGGEAIAPAKQGERMLRFMGNQRHSGTIFDPSERARLMSHANRLRGVEDPMPTKGTVQQKIAVLSGRHTGEAATGAQVLSAIEHDPKLAREVLRQVSPESAAMLKQGLWKKISEAGEDRTAWGHQRTGEQIAKFVNTELARAVFTPNELMMMRTIADAHHRLVPVPGSTNPSGTAHTAKKLLAGMRHQLLGLFGFAHGGIPGASIALGMGKALEWVGEKKAAKEATRLFLGQQARTRAPSTLPQAALVAAAQVPALRSR